MRGNGNGVGRFVTGLVRRSRRPAPLRVELAVEFTEAVRGAKKFLAYSHLDDCRHCADLTESPGNGSGTSPCKRCSGLGKLRVRQGRFSLGRQDSCPACAGSGITPDHACFTCRGAGLALRSRVLEVQVPAGTETGARQRIAEAGHRAQPGGSFGPLDIDITVLPHPNFTRKGTELFSSVRVSFIRAALGGVLEAPTLEGLRHVRLPPGTAHGSTLTVRGGGLKKRLSSKRGDQIVTVALEIPKTLSPRAEELVTELGRELQQGPNVPENHPVAQRTQSWFQRRS